MPSPNSWSEYWQELKPHYVRLYRCIRHPFTRGHKDRLGVVDLQHAYVNVDVESARFDPYKYGHLVSWGRLIWVPILIYALVT